MCVRGYDSSKKAMFWDSEGVILAHCVPKGTIVMGQSYEDVLRKMRASSNLRKETMLVQVSLSAYLLMRPKQLNKC